MAWRIPIPLRIGFITSKAQVETESGPPSSEEFLEAQARAGVLGRRTYRKSTVLPLSKRGEYVCSLDQRFGRAWSSSHNAMLDLFVHDSTNAMNHTPCRLRKPSHIMKLLDMTLDSCELKSYPRNPPICGWYANRSAVRPGAFPNTPTRPLNLGDPGLDLAGKSVLHSPFIA